MSSSKKYDALLDKLAKFKEDKKMRCAASTMDIKENADRRKTIVISRSSSDQKVAQKRKSLHSCTKPSFPKKAKQEDDMRKKLEEWKKKKEASEMNGVSKNTQRRRTFIPTGPYGVSFGIDLDFPAKNIKSGRKSLPAKSKTLVNKNLARKSIAAFSTVDLKIKDKENNTMHNSDISAHINSSNISGSQKKNRDDIDSSNGRRSSSRSFNTIGSQSELITDNPPPNNRTKVSTNFNSANKIKVAQTTCMTNKARSRLSNLAESRNIAHTVSDSRLSLISKMLVNKKPKYSKHVAEDSSTRKSTRFEMQTHARGSSRVAGQNILNTSGGNKKSTSKVQSKPITLSNGIRGKHAKSDNANNHLQLNKSKEDITELSIHEKKKIRIKHVPSRIDTGLSRLRKTAPVQAKKTHVKAASPKPQWNSIVKSTSPNTRPSIAPDPSQSTKIKSVMSTPLWNSSTKSTAKAGIKSLPIKPKAKTFNYMLQDKPGEKQSVQTKKMSSGNTAPYSASNKTKYKQRKSTISPKKKNILEQTPNQLVRKPRKSILKTPGPAVSESSDSEEHKEDGAALKVRFFSPQLSDVTGSNSGSPELGTSDELTTSPEIGNTSLNEKHISMRRKLDGWLKTKGKTPSKYNGLRKFDQAQSAKKKRSWRSPKVGDINLRDDELPVLPPLESSFEDDEEEEKDPITIKVEHLLKECKLLLDSDCPPTSVSAWLEYIVSDIPSTRLHAAYWVLRASIAEKQGHGDAQVVSVFEEAVRHNVKNPDEIADALTAFVLRMRKKQATQKSSTYIEETSTNPTMKNLSTPKSHCTPCRTPRNQPGVEPETIFKSSAIKYSMINTTTPFFKRLKEKAENGGLDTPGTIITPVRRSARISNSNLPSMLKDHDSVVDSISDIPNEVQLEALFRKNLALKESIFNDSEESDSEISVFEGSYILDPSAVL